MSGKLEISIEECETGYGPCNAITVKHNGKVILEETDGVSLKTKF